MGMLMHHTWLEQQKQEKPKKVETAPVEEPKKESQAEEPVEESTKRGRRKISK